MARSRIKAADIMTKEVVIANPDMTVVEAAKLMNKFRIGGIPVLEQGKLIGMITERDIMKGIVEPNKLAENIKIKEIMTTPPKISGLEHEDMSSIVQKMNKYGVTRVPIVDTANRLRGMVTNRDVLINCNEYMETLLEQARIKGIDEDYTAYGRCELCGENTHLMFKNNKFVCDSCILDNN